MSLCFYYQQIYNIMKYNLFDNFYEVIEVIYNLPDNLKNGLIARLLIKRTISPFCSSLGAVFSTYRDFLSIFGHNYAK
jgi:hypothetical protein